MSMTTDFDDSTVENHVIPNSPHLFNGNGVGSSDGITIPFNLLCGEVIDIKEPIVDGILFLSNYRLFFHNIVNTAQGKDDFNVPLGLIYYIEIKDMVHLCLCCKDVKTYRCTFRLGEICSKWYDIIMKAISPPKNLSDLFSYKFFEKANEEGGEEISSYLQHNVVLKDNFELEYERLRFGIDTAAWRVTSLNTDFKICSSYPKKIIVPTRCSDRYLESSAKFRSSRRLPAVVWRHKDNGMVLARSSQPEVGLFCWRCEEDEILLKAISESCARDVQSVPKLLLMDARSYTSATANRARRGGHEFMEYYPNIDIVFMNLSNIHQIRKSFLALRSLCALPAENPSFHSMLENTKWLHHMSTLINSAVRAANALEKDMQPVLVHCSDGWDRTSQIVSLTELLLDPYYRTIEGFQVLVEREWLEFGHKFSDRCGLGTDPSEKCPIFLQWLDCVYNITLQFPCAFEFSKRYLIKLAEHTYSNLFGTFLCNTNEERHKFEIFDKTFSVWKYLQHDHFKNFLYKPNSDRVLWPKFNVRDLQVWHDLYMDLTCDNQAPVDSSQIVRAIEIEFKPGVLAIEPESGSLNNLGNNLDSMLESAINCQPDTNSEYNYDSSSSGNSRGVSESSNINFNCDDDKISSDIEKEQISTESSEILNNLHIIDKNKEEFFSPCILNRNECDDSLNKNIINVNTIPLKLLRILDSNEDEKEIAICNGKTFLNEEQNSCDIIKEHDVSSINSKCLDLKQIHTIDVNSVQTSTETIVNIDDFNSNSDDEYLDNKTVTITNNLGSYDLLTFNVGRQQLTSLLLDPIDGLPLIPDDIQDRCQQIHILNETQINAIQKELHATRQALMNKIVNEGVIQPTVTHHEKQHPLDDDKGSVCSTDKSEQSWVAVDERDVISNQTLWVPDHAVQVCSSCELEFGIVRRRHHCRNCGKIFCGHCSDKFAPVPNEQLYDPVRVCEACYDQGRQTKYTTHICRLQA